MADPDRTRLLTPVEIDAGLAELTSWDRDGDRLRCELVFADFAEAFAFMTRVALVAETLYHHPEWSNVWNRVEMAITNHEAGGLTELDLEFARRVDAIGR